MAWPVIAAAAGAATGGISTLLSGNKQSSAYKKQKDFAWKKYLINKEFADIQFGIQKGEALAGLSTQKRRLGEDVNAGVENYNLGLLGQAYGIQDGQIGLASQTGAYDAARGASGTRGNDADGLVKAYARTQFDRNLELQDTQNRQQLQGMMTQAGRGVQDIANERSSWGPDGYRTQLYTAEDERNRKLALLGQAELEYAASQSKPGIFDYLTGGIMGSSTGLNLYSGIANASQYAGSSSGSWMGTVNNYGTDWPAFNGFGGNAGGITFKPLQPGSTMK
ncbi:MAG: hypothetical protein LBI67_12005 [Treponema sp.]|jgi:hypothetical protein|nr:hypothetical protein [Treponema sp.]